jgi:hypothetical protein
MEETNDYIKNIHVCENFLTEEELEKTKKIIKTNNWKWGHTSVTDYEMSTPFWSMDLINDEYFTVYLKSIIEKYFSKKFKLIRVYANGQTFGQDGTYHLDDTEKNRFTFVLYISEIAKDFLETVGGNIYFKIPNEKYKICFEPVTNRGILFPSNYLHKANSFSRYVMNLRICVAWKMEEILYV